MSKIKMYLILLFISVFLFFLTIRGNTGNPTPNQIEYQLSSSGQTFETSQERSRWAMILSLVNNHTVIIDNYASIGTPDIGRINGHYFSFFPPGESIIAIPFYILGTKIGASQLSVFLIPTIFSFLTMCLIIAISTKLKLHWSVALFSAIAFGFGTNAWGYSITLYAHLLSAFFLLLGIYLTFWEERWWKIIGFWIAYSIGVFIDFPNLFIFLPLALYNGFNSFQFSQSKATLKIKISWIRLLAPFLFILLMFGYGYYNYKFFGSPTKLSNTIPRVQDLKIAEKAVPETGKSNDAVSALQTRQMLRGFTSFIFSLDRGVLIYSPIILLFIFGLGLLQKRDKYIEIILFTTATTCLILYTMFGDPYGGWAFGSRYMIAVMPELCLLTGMGLQKFSKSVLIKGIYTCVFIYSSAISLLAPLTTNVIPPFVEARYINLRSDYLINILMLQKNQLDSFFYNQVLHKAVSGSIYYAVIAAIVFIIGTLLIWIKKTDYEA